MNLGSGIRNKPIPDPGSRGQKAPDPRSGSATLQKIMVSWPLLTAYTLLLRPPLTKILCLSLFWSAAFLVRWPQLAWIWLELENVAIIVNVLMSPDGGNNVRLLLEHEWGEGKLVQLLQCWDTPVRKYNIGTIYVDRSLQQDQCKIRPRSAGIYIKYLCTWD